MTELVINFRKQSGRYALVCINGAEVEVDESIKFLGINITNNLSWVHPCRRHGRGTMARRILIPTLLGFTVIATENGVERGLVAIKLSSEEQSS
eukprot:g34377.t1